MVGSFLIEEMTKKFDVTVADLHKPESNRVKYVKIDLRKPFSVSNDFEIGIHLGAIVGGIEYFPKHPVENMRDNPRMTTNFLDAVVNSNISQIIYASSSSIYENQNGFPTEEDFVNKSPPPVSPYGMSKLIGEYLCKAYNQQFGVSYTILRPSNVYGPKEFPDPGYARVIPQLIKKVLSGQYPVEIYGSGQQTRTFTHGRDVSRAFLKSMYNKNAFNETFNVAGDEEIKIKEVLELIWQIVGITKKLKVKNLHDLPHDVLRRFPSNKKIKKKLNWKPEISLEQGLRETVTWLSNL